MIYIKLDTQQKQKHSQIPFLCQTKPLKTQKKKLVLFLVEMKKCCQDLVDIREAFLEDHRLQLKESHFR